MSRHTDPKQSQNPSHLSRVDAYINFVTTNAVPPAVTLQEVKDARAADETLQSLARVITNRRWREVGKDVSQYQQIKQELSISNGVILRRARIIVPEKLQSEMVMLAHSGHRNCQNEAFPAIFSLVSRDRQKGVGIGQRVHTVSSCEP